MVFDCFTYFDERDIIRVRFEELNDVVDYFVVVEARQTFTGLPKPLYFDDLPHWIDRWSDRIIRVVTEFPWSTMTPWEREAFQRNQIMQALQSVPSNDLILISDADEIPRHDCIQDVKNPVQLDVTQYFWKFNWQVPTHCNQGARPVLARRSSVEQPHTLRISQLPRIPNAGWHFSFFGDDASTRSKINSFSHTEMNTKEYKSSQHIQKCIREGIDPFERFPLKYTEIDDTFPEWVQQHTSELAHLILTRSQNAGARA